MPAEAAEPDSESHRDSQGQRARILNRIRARFFYAPAADGLVLIGALFYDWRSPQWKSRRQPVFLRDPARKKSIRYRCKPCVAQNPPLHWILVDILWGSQRIGRSTSRRVEKVLIPGLLFLENKEMQALPRFFDPPGECLWGFYCRVFNPVRLSIFFEKNLMIQAVVVELA